MSSMYNGVEIRKLPDAPSPKSRARGYGFTGVCSGSKSARRSNTLGDHIISKTTSQRIVGVGKKERTKKVSVSAEKKFVKLPNWRKGK
jgi:hypothetical protein